MGNLSIDPRVVQMIRKWILEQEADRVTQDKMRKLLGGVSRTTIINIRDSSRGAGPKVEAAFARLMFGGSVDALRQAASGEKTAHGGGRLAVVRDDRYESRTRAAEAARALGYADLAIEHVQSMSLEGDEDPGAEFWLEQMRAANGKVKRGVPL
jgi:hypothetical protein